MVRASPSVERLWPDRPEYQPATSSRSGGSRFSPRALVAPPGDTITTDRQYRVAPLTTWVTGPGCYAFEVAGLNFSQLIVFQALPAR
jgi:hypothetical protein